MTDNRENRSATSIPAFTTFIPFGTLLIYSFYPIMPLRWVYLATLLKSISLLSICINIIDGDLLWSIFGILTYVVVSTPLYLNAARAHRVEEVQKNCDKIAFTKLFETCSDAIFSDYRIALTATIPLPMQVITAGSTLYGVFGADWIMHALAGFGISMVASKAYKTAVTYYGYSQLISYFQLDRLRVSGIEKKISWLGFALFSLVIVELTWEVAERIIHLSSPTNVFRMGPEPLWNAIGDVVSAVIGGMVAWYLVRRKLKWL